MVVGNSNEAQKTVTTERKYTIVGIDPGTTIGIAAIDLNGELVGTFSSRTYSISEVITWIMARGKPLIIASDVVPVPAMVKKIRSAFSSLLHHMDKSLSIEEKIALTKGKGYEYGNVHERDALAACIEAFRQYHKKFSQVEKKTPAGMDAEEVKALVVRGVAISIAINRLEMGRVEGKVESDTREKGAQTRASAGAGESARNEDIIKLRRIIKDKNEHLERLKELVADLEGRLNGKEREIKNLVDKIGYIKSVRKKEIKKAEELKKKEKELSLLKEKVKEREKENEELRKIIAELKGEREGGGIKEIKDGESKRIKIIKSFSRKAILDVDRKYGLKKENIVFLEDGSGGGATTVELLVKKGVKAVVYDKELSHFAVDKFVELSIPFFRRAEIPLQMEGDSEFAFADRRLLNQKIKEWKNKRKVCFGFRV